jgi:ribonuclease G
MNKELYVSSTPHETKVALMEDDQLAEVFFERDNEYTLAGSIYKGRVTRVLPGMQSAFVDIGLERDAFLYVSDFLELTGDEEEDEEFGAIPAPRGAIDVSKPQLPEEAQAASPQTTFVGADTEEDSATFTEDFSAPGDEQSVAGENGEAASGEDGESGEGARRWRGRRRRGGRRGRPDERDAKPESTIEAAQVQETPAPPPPPRAESRHEPRHDSRPRTDYGPPAGYTPILLPGESISKYRNLAQSVAETQSASTVEDVVVPAAPAGDFPPPEPEAVVQQEIEEETTHLDQGYIAEEPEQVAAPVVAEDSQPRGRRGFWRSRRKSAAPVESEAPAIATHEETVVAPEETEHSEAAHHMEAPAPEIAGGPTTEAVADALQNHEHNLEVEPHAPTESYAAAAPVTTEEHVDGEPRAANAPTYDDSNAERIAAPSVAPEGRTLEHEVLEDEEAEFQPVPDDLSAMSEVAGDEELVLEEETLDSDNYSDRWIPKIADVDEDEVVAAEMRGENILAADEDEEDEEDGEETETETNGRAEVRATSPTVGYQQRQAERPGYGRRDYRDRGRRGGSRRNVRARPNNNRNQPLITDLLKEGQEVLIQIAKEPIGKKGARITSHIALPGRFLVYMPTVNHVGVSRKIASDEERQRLKRIVTSERENGVGGFIVRTAAANIKEEDLRADIRFLKHLWAEIKNRAENGKSPALIYHDLNLVERVLRDQVNADFSQIWVDTEDEYERVVRFANRFQPSLVRRIKLYTKDTPLYEQFGIQDEINRSLKSKVWLKSGGHIVINQTEALVAIDVNTGKFVGKTQRLEDTIVKVNVDAIKEIVRQIRLRDLGGIIVIDFIDMDERKNRQKVMMALEEALRNDRAPSKVLQFNDFGLVAITRKRVKQSLERTLGESCPYCVGAGFVKSVTTVCNELYIEMRKMAKIHDHDDITLRVNPEVAKALKANNGKLIGELEELTGKSVLVKSDPALHQENFDIH